MVWIRSRLLRQSTPSLPVLDKEGIANTLKGHLGQRRPLRYDSRPAIESCCRPFDNTSNHINPTPELGNFHVLFRHAGRLVPTHLPSSTIQYRSSTRWDRHSLGSHLYAHGSGQQLARTLRPAVLSGLCGEYHPHWIHVHRQWILYARRASTEAELVVLLNRRLDDHWWST